ncbi:MAG: tetratricopeptide repeat protein [Gallionellaceae bacterium]|nr:tetratricopeptide repeat protein [Gallionellaceae bacterium]
MRGLWLLLVLVAGGAHAEGFWPSLWRSADQRGEQLLRQGDAAAAARTYADPRRRAYAEFKAGDYAAAAHDFAAFDDSDAHYNRGNALAHVGDLAAALKAYDSALARDPNNRDARQNRELVAKALQQQAPPPKQSGGQGQSGKQGGKEGKSSGQSGPQKQGAPGQSLSDQTGKPGQEQRAGKPGDQGRGVEQAGRDKAANVTDQGGGQNRQNQPAGNEAEQARRDAEAGLGANRRGGDGKSATGQGDAAGNAKQRGLAETPRGEQQLAREQWLRQIPDDPGGLLRRKFMIEHLMRQQGNQR